MKPNIYTGVSMAEYLEIKAVSASIIKKANTECPKAAWADSWLNQKRVIDDNEATDRGTICHSILLEGSEDCLVAIDPNDHPAEKTGNIPEGWTNKSIRSARDAARDAGKIPILLADYASIMNMVSAAWDFIQSLKDSEPAVWAMFQQDGGKSEETVIWQDGKTLCKMRTDRWSLDRSVICDYKTTERSVEPSSWGRSQLIGMGYYLSAAWYRRGALAATGVQPDYVFLAQQVNPPYLCSLVGVEPAMLEAGARMIDQGLIQWERCVEANYWPAYPSRVCYPETPAYMLAQWEEAELRHIEEHGLQVRRDPRGQWMTQEELNEGAI